MRGDIPAWFTDTIRGGFKLIVALSLPGTPGPDMITTTVDAWAGTLWVNHYWLPDDADRMAKGFVKLAAHIDRWPAPRHLLEHMPARPYRTALDRPQLSDDERGKLGAKIHGLAVQLRSKTRST